MTGAAAAAGGGTGRHQSIAAWAKAHKPEAFLGVAGIAVGIYAYVKERGNSSSSSSQQSTSGADTLSPGVGGGDWAYLSGGVGPSTDVSPGPNAPAPTKGTKSKSKGRSRKSAQDQAQENIDREYARAHHNIEDAYAQAAKNRRRAYATTRRQDQAARERTASNPEDRLQALDALERADRFTGPAGGGAPVVLGKT